MGKNGWQFHPLYFKTILLITLLASANKSWEADKHTTTLPTIIYTSNGIETYNHDISVFMSIFPLYMKNFCGK